MTTPSPWEQALGSEIERLHPRLRAYFGPIPAGSIGYGRGVFTRVGSPRRCLRPLLAVLAAEGVLSPGWAADVPFRIRNEPGPSRVEARRRFEFASGPWTMRDVVSIERGVLTDRLGRRGILSVTLRAEVDDGALVLRSTGVRVFGVVLPRLIAPTLVLTETWDDDLSAQRVAFRLGSRLWGRLYEYEGTFRYRVVRPRGTGVVDG